MSGWVWEEGASGGVGKEEGDELGEDELGDERRPVDGGRGEAIVAWQASSV